MRLRDLGVLALGGALLSGCDPAGDLSDYEGRSVAEPALIEDRRPLPEMSEPRLNEPRRREPLGVNSRRTARPAPAQTLSIPTTPVTPPRTVPHQPFEGVIPFNDGTGAPRNPIVRGNISR